VWQQALVPTPAIDHVDDYWTASVGVGFQTGRFMFDVAYEFKWGENVNSDVYGGYGITEDVHRHRFLASLILYL